MYELIQKRPWAFPLILAPIPLVVSLFGIVLNMGGGPAIRLVFQPVQVETAAGAPWPMILRPTLISGLLVGLFAWLAVALPNSMALKPRKMTHKRAAAALFSFLSAGTLWLGIVLGEIAWRVALFGSGGLQEAASLEISPWLYFIAALGTAMFLYRLVRPRARR